MSRHEHHYSPYLWNNHFPQEPCATARYSYPHPWQPAGHSYVFDNAQASSSSSALSLPMWSKDSFDLLLQPLAHPPSEHAVPELGFSPTPSDSDAALSPLSSRDAEPSPAPEFTHVVCNAPLVAPIPLPYHSPTFLRYDDLPDADEDLSHPPYTRRPQKRKRSFDAVDDAALGPSKRRTLLPDFARPLVPLAARHPPARGTQPHAHAGGTLRQGRPR